MKKISLLLISLFLFVGIGTTNVVAETADTIKNSTTSKQYANLAEAIEQVEDGETLVLLQDTTAVGISVPGGKNFTFDLDGHTYSIGEPGAGSEGTKTQGFQLLEGSTIVFKNGTIQCTEANKDVTWQSDSLEKGIAMLIQNYANLTLENITLDGNNIAHNGSNIRYVLSNNCGTVNINGSSIIARDGDFAFDSCKYGSYDAPTVNVKGTIITGKVEASGGAINFETGTTVKGQVRVGENKKGGAIGSVVTVEEGATLNNSGNYAAVVFGNNTLNISGTVNGMVGTNGNDYNGNETINVKDNATITNESDVAMYIPNGTLNISGGTITGKTAVYFKSTNINITGGTLIGIGEKEEYQYDGNGCKPTGDALVIDSCNYPHDIVNVSVSGGVFVSQKGSSIASFTYNGGKKQTGFISGGSFTDVTLEALNYLASDAEVEYTLSENVNVDHQIEITEGKKLTLNLGDNTLAYNGTSLSSGVLLVHNGADVTINANNGGINSGSNAYAAIALTKSGDNDTKTAKLTINGGTFSGYYYGITGNGNRQNTSITINGGNIKGTEEDGSTGIYNPQKGTLTINGGTIEGATGIYVKSGKVVTSITGGTIKGVGKKDNFSHSDNGFNSTGDAIVFENCNYPGGAPNADIRGGKYYSKNANAVASYSTTDYEPIKKFISGGLYSKEVDSELISTGYKCVSNNDENTKTDYPYKVELVDEESFVEETISTDATDATLKTLVDGDVTVTKVTGLENTKSSSEKQDLINTVKTTYPNAENIDVQIVLNANKVVDTSTEANSIKIDSKVKAVNGVAFKNFVDLTIDLEVKVDGEVKYKEKIPNTSAYQYIPIKAEGDLSSCDVKKIIVVRNHKDNIEILTKAASRNDAQHFNGDCFFIETIDSARYIVVKSNKFSVYGLAMQTNDVNEYKYVAPTPYTPGGYVPPKTGVN